MEIIRKISFDLKVDRIGPDIPFTHWKLHFKSSMRKLCHKKFKKFGQGSEFRPGAFAFGCSNISIGNNVIIRPNSLLFSDPSPNGAGIIIEDYVLIGSGVHIYVSNHRFDNPNIPIYFQGHHESKEVILKKGCWLGANCIILPGVVIGENSVVGAGAVVTKSIPNNVMAAGNPAKVIRNLKEKVNF